MTSGAFAVDDQDELSIISLGAHALTYASGGFAYKLVALLSVPIFARILTPAQLGLLDLAAVVASGIALVVAIGLDHGIAYVAPRSEDEPGVWASGTLLVTLAAVTVALVGVVLQEPIAVLLTGDAGNRLVMSAAAVYGGVSGFAVLALTAVRLRGRSRTYAAASFLIVAAELAAALVVAVVLAGGVPAIVIGWAVGSLVVGVPVLVRHLPSLVRPRVATAARLARFGLPLVPAALAWVIGDAFIRAVIAHELEPSSLGEYGIAVRLASVLALLIGGLGVAWHPYLYRSTPDRVAPRSWSVGVAAISAITAMALALAVLGAELAVLVAGPAYAGAARAVVGLSAGMIGFCAVVLLTSVVGRSGSTRAVAVAAIGGALTQAVAALVLVPERGLFGAGIASALGYGVAAVVMGLAATPAVQARVSTRLVVAAVAGIVLVLLAGLLLDRSLLERIIAGAVLAGTALAIGVLVRSRKPA